MQINERTKEEVKNKAESMSDLLRMEYLEKCLRNINDIGVHKYCCLELSRLYEKHMMFSDAIKFLEILHSKSTTKKEIYIIAQKAIEIVIKSGDYKKIGFFYKRALDNCEETEKLLTRRKIIELLNIEAEKHDQQKRYSSLEKTYEQLLLFSPEIDKNDIRKKLLIVYKKLGKVRESLKIEQEIN